MQMTSLEIKFITGITGIEKNKVHPIGKQTDCPAEVMEIKFNVNLVFKVQNQSLADVSQNRGS